MKNTKVKHRINIIVSILLWVLIWFIVSLIIDNALLFPSPFDVIKALFACLGDSAFYHCVLFSFGRIALGFLIGLLGGFLLGILSNVCDFLKTFIETFIRIIKSIPVASIVVLLLIWFDAGALSTIVSALLCLPLFYQGTLLGYESTDQKLIYMAKVYRIRPLRKFVNIFLPKILLNLSSVSKTASGFALKSGIAAEVIGLVRYSVGNEIYKAKMYLETPRLFALTITIILLGCLFEFVCSCIFKKIKKLVGGNQ